MNFFLNDLLRSHHERLPVPTAADDDESSDSNSRSSFTVSEEKIVIRLVNDNARRHSCPPSYVQKHRQRSDSCTSSASSPSSVSSQEEPTLSPISFSNDAVSFIEGPGEALTFLASRRKGSACLSSSPTLTSSSPSSLAMSSATKKLNESNKSSLGHHAMNQKELVAAIARDCFVTTSPAETNRKISTVQATQDMLEAALLVSTGGTTVSRTSRAA
jgi:hypothetical protein